MSTPAWELGVGVSAWASSTSTPEWAFLGLLPPFLTLSQSAHRPPDAHLGGVLGAVGLDVLPPPAFSGVSGLALHLFCPSEQAASEELFRRGLDLFFCLSDNRTLFFVLLNVFSPPFCFLMLCGKLPER